jgi:hypothetical protein
MRVAEIRETWGDSFILVGGMDNVHMLPRASRAEIEAAARDAHEVARQGGVILGSHSIDEDVPVESYDAYDGVLAPRNSRVPT